MEDFNIKILLLGSSDIPFNAINALNWEYSEHPLVDTSFTNPLNMPNLDQYSQTFGSGGRSFPSEFSLLWSDLCNVKVHESCNSECKVFNNANVFLISTSLFPSGTKLQKKKNQQ